MEGFDRASFVLPGELRCGCRSGRGVRRARGAWRCAEQVRRLIADGPSPPFRPCRSAEDRQASSASSAVVDGPEGRAAAAGSSSPSTPAQADAVQRPTAGAVRRGRMRCRRTTRSRGPRSIRSCGVVAPGGRRSVQQFGVQHALCACGECRAARVIASHQRFGRGPLERLPPTAHAECRQRGIEAPPVGDDLAVVDEVVLAGVVDGDGDDRASAVAHMCIRSASRFLLSRRLVRVGLSRVP